MVIHCWESIFLRGCQCVYARVCVWERERDMQWLSFSFTLMCVLPDLVFNICILLIRGWISFLPSPWFCSIRKETLVWIAQYVHLGCCNECSYCLCLQMMESVFHAVTLHTCVPSSLPNSIMKFDSAKRRTNMLWITLKLRMLFTCRINSS